jgi:hypothetical protein
MGLIDLMGIATKADQAGTDHMQDAALASALLRQETVDAGQNDALEAALTNQAKWNAEHVRSALRESEREARIQALEERLGNYKTELDDVVSQLAAHEQRLQQLSGAMRLAAQQLLRSADEDTNGD